MSYDEFDNLKKEVLEFRLWWDYKHRFLLDKKAPKYKCMLHLDYKYDRLSIQINVKIGGMSLQGNDQSGM